MADEQEEAFLRPFLTGSSAPSSEQVATSTTNSGRRAESSLEDSEDSESSNGDLLVRAYVMTAGAGPSTVSLGFESMVSLAHEGQTALENLTFERGKIARLVAKEAQSVAEIAARLGIPIGISQILCGDMVGANLLEHHQPNQNMSDDVSLLTRLINGVRSL